MDTTDRTHRLGLPYLANDQAQKHVTVNEGLRALDAVVQPSVASIGATVQPDAPAPGQAHVLGPQPSGPAWSGFAEHDLATFQDGAWTAFPPSVGLTVWAEDAGRHYVWTGTIWAATAGGGGGGPAAPQTRAARFGVNADADDTNRLIVKSDAVLHSHDDASGQGSGDARHVLNKAGIANTASLVFQSGFAGRAEIGLAGGDDFAVKVSADGAAFVEAIRIDRTTGAVSLPNTPASAPSGGGGGPETITALLRAPFTRVDDAALAPIPGLDGIALPGDSVWRIAMTLYVEGPSTTDSTLDIRTDGQGASGYIAEDGQRSRFPAVAMGAGLRLETETQRHGSVHVSGVLTTGPDAATYDFVWGQRRAGPDPVTMHPGSHLVLTRLA